MRLVVQICLSLVTSWLIRSEISVVAQLTLLLILIILHIQQPHHIDAVVEYLVLDCVVLYGLIVEGRDFAALGLMLAVL